MTTISKPRGLIAVLIVLATLAACRTEPPVRSISRNIDFEPFELKSGQVLVRPILDAAANTAYGCKDFRKEFEAGMAKEIHERFKTLGKWPEIDTLGSSSDIKQRVNNALAGAGLRVTRHMGWTPTLASAHSANSPSAAPGARQSPAPDMNDPGITYIYIDHHWICSDGFVVEAEEDAETSTAAGGWSEWKYVHKEGDEVLGSATLQIQLVLIHGGN